MSKISTRVQDRFTKYASEYYSAKNSGDSDTASEIFEYLGFDSHGFDTVGSGRGRIVCDMDIVGHSGFVVKFARPDGMYDGVEQNRREVEIWKQATAEQREYLVPIVEFGPDNYWIVMPKGNPVTTIPYEWKQTVKYELDDLIWVEDLRDENVVLLDGDPRICDYGVQSK